MNRLDVALGERGYPILIGADLLAASGPGQDALSDLQLCAVPGGQPHRCLVVTDENVARHHLPALAGCLQRAPSELPTLVLPAGEQHKTLANFGRILDACAAAGLRRDDLLIALGGGVIGDLAGFAAASYMRGIDFLQIPTTLLAMVDSSVGGKTGLNLAAGKNLAGAFWQPRLVLADTATLTTLDRREYRAGLAEVVKYAAIGDPSLFEWLVANVAAINAADAGAVAWMVEQSCRHKAAIVARDEREHGDRALLNLGHTFGHALEAALDYQGLLHGEAVAIGMVQAARLSTQLGLASAADHDRLRTLLVDLGLPVDPPALPVERLEHHMALDKKASRSGLRFVLWRGIGEAFIATDVPAEAVREVLGAGPGALGPGPSQPNG
ncbi:MAG: 3-dehydroquinate synthase [Lysobacterales bacterium]